MRCNRVDRLQKSLQYCDAGISASEQKSINVWNDTPFKIHTLVIDNIIYTSTHNMQAESQLILREHFCKVISRTLQQLD